MVEDATSLGAMLDACDKLRLTVDVLWDPKVFAYRYNDVFAQYKTGLVIADGLSTSSFGDTAPSADNLAWHLANGGSLILAAQGAEQNNVNIRFLEDYFRFSYVTDDRELPTLKFAGPRAGAGTFSFNGNDSAQSAKDVTIMEGAKPAEPFLVTEDGRAGALAIKGTSGTGNPYRAVFLGFRFEAVDGADNRTLLLQRAVESAAPALLPSALPTPQE